jgi:hypothetical protein
MCDSSRFFVDNYSRVDAAPASELRDASGNLILKLETTDISALQAAGFKFPEPFMVKAADGQTNLYGVMYKPFDFNPERKYPIIAYVYPGPQTESVSKSFSPPIKMSLWPRWVLSLSRLATEAAVQCAPSGTIIMVMAICVIMGWPIKNMLLSSWLPVIRSLILTGLGFTVTRAAVL